MHNQIDNKPQQQTNLLKTNFFGILPETSAANVQSIFSDEAMVIKTDTATTKKNYV